MRRLWREGVPSAGLFAGAIGWLACTQLNYALAPWLCTAGIGWSVPLSAGLFTIISLAGGLFSWRAWTHRAKPPRPALEVARPQRLLAGVGALSAALFALVIVLQGMAGLVVQGCPS